MIRQKDQYKEQHTVNGWYYEFGTGCHLAPTCLACPTDGICKKGTSKDVWQGGIPKCLSPKNCVNCETRECLVGVIS